MVDTLTILVSCSIWREVRDDVGGRGMGKRLLGTIRRTFALVHHEILPLKIFRTRTRERGIEGGGR